MSPMFSANKSLTSLQNILVFNLDLLPSPYLARHVCSLRGKIDTNDKIDWMDKHRANDLIMDYIKSIRNKTYIQIDGK